MNKTVVVSARRWFDKANGNTYHSVKVYYDGNIVNKDLGDATEIHYGYGSAWEQTVKDLLVRHGIYEDSTWMLRRMIEEENNDILIWDCVDVQKKKDLKFYY